MDNLKTNKILAGFLLAGLLAMGGGKIAEILVPDQALDENAYPVEIKQVADSGQATTPVIKALSLSWHCLPLQILKLELRLQKNAPLVMNLMQMERIRQVQCCGIL